MKISDLQENIGNYESALNTIIRKRETWQNETQGLLIKTLNEVVENYKINWHVQTVELAKNYGGGNLALKSRPAGILKKDGDSIKNYITKGGGLIFSQAYNGDIFVIISYPHVEDIVKQANHEVLKRLKPSQITRDLILQKVSIFLQRMAEWEGDTQGSSLGFKFAKDDEMQYVDENYLFK
ncbi:MAG: hypothetical protein KAT76_01295 [Bacteroidales bacterium]|nr:hypothetical protein [Bacteroidales bacterium]